MGRQHATPGDDRRRERVARVLDDFGVRVQESVFELWLREEDWEVLEARLAPLLAEGVGEVRFYPLCRSCRQKVRRMGTQEGAPAFERPSVIIL
ncbi:MAG: CRISPR-associated endonuclease Cas2 [Thermoguttaceae bacterium]|nr:CRISPR-associated endonuclease Cas2 [Thermoguttaceae bacterium]